MVPDTWNSPWQTRHHILSRLARFFHVVWMEPAREWRENLRKSKAKLGWSAAPQEPPGLEVYSPEFLLPKLYRPAFLERRFLGWRLRRARRLLVQRGCRKIILYLWRPEFSDALESVAFDGSCYHIDDEYSFSDVDLPLNEEEVRLIARVDQVFIHSQEIVMKKGSINPRTVRVPNGVDYDAYASTAPEPLDLRTIPHPRIGYTGYLKRTLNWELCIDLARTHPEWSLVFVGPVAEHPEVHKPIQDLSRLSNVHFLGLKGPQELAAYPQHFDVCIMPYRTDTHSMRYGYPLKLHEYLASGRPSVGSPLLSLKEFAGQVALASTSHEWSAAIRNALSLDANTPEQRAKRQEIARQYDWRCLVSRIANAMAQILGQQTADDLAHLTGGKDA
jgi:hypothetical protein